MERMPQNYYLIQGLETKFFFFLFFFPFFFFEVCHSANQCVVYIKRMHEIDHLSPKVADSQILLNWYDRLITQPNDVVPEGGQCSIVRVQLAGRGSAVRQ